MSNDLELDEPVGARVVGAISEISEVAAEAGEIARTEWQRSHGHAPRAAREQEAVGTTV